MIFSLVVQVFNIIFSRHIVIYFKLYLCRLTLIVLLSFLFITGHGVFNERDSFLLPSFFFLIILFFHYFIFLKNQENWKIFYPI